MSPLYVVDEDVVRAYHDALRAFDVCPTEKSARALERARRAYNEFTARSVERAREELVKVIEE